MHRNCEIIGVASGWGAQQRGCEDGPESLYKKVALKSCKVEQKYLWGILYPLFQEKHQNVDLEHVLPLITDLNCHISQAVCDAIKREYFPIIVGGDHSMAVGTWTGVKESMASSEKMGLIWIDAHMDSHIPGTSPSGAWHGMPLAALLGCGDPAFCPSTKHPVLLPEHVCLIGVRSFESGEQELLKRMKVKVFSMDEVKKRGLVEVTEEAIQLVSKGTAGFGVSLDMDVIDPKEAPGVGTPATGGIVNTDFFKMLNLLIQNPHLLAFEIAEYNPYKDRDERTACICLEILGRIIGHGKPKK